MGTSNRRCICGADISDRQPQCVRCEECQKEYRLFISARNKQKRRENKAAHRDTDLGTTDFNAHRKEDFEEEATAIKKELKKLGLR